MDWNIFFSTISQTSGAIVGIFAAFLITKIVNNQSEYLRNEEKASDFIHKSIALEDETKTRYFDWYNEKILEEELREIDKRYDKNNEILTKEEYYNLLRFSPYQSKVETLASIQKKVDELSEKKSTQKSRRSSTPRLMPLEITTARTQNIAEEREQIDNLFIRATMQSRMNHELLVSLRSNPGSSPLVSISIIAVILLFFSGVIYPLSFLPLKPNTDISLSLGAFWSILSSLKGFLLTLISIIFCGLMLVFIYINHNLKYKEITFSKLEKYSHINNYSVYFKNKKDSKQSLNKQDQPNVNEFAD